MSDRPPVIEDGVVPVPKRDSSGSSWLVAVVAFLTGLGLGLLVVQPGAEPVPEPTAVSTVATVAPAPATDPVRPSTQISGVSDEIPGFPDSLVLVARTATSSLEHLLWPVSGEVASRAMSGGTGAALDVESEFIATTERFVGGEGSVLSMGRFNTMRVVATGALSYSWHDGEVGALSYTASRGGRAVLHVVGPDLEIAGVTVLSSPSATVAGWGEWGWALQQSPNVIALYSPDGVFKDTESGTALATHPSGWVLAAEDDGELKLVSAGGGVRRLEARPDVGGLRAGAISPDFTRVAVTGDGGVAVVDLASEQLISLSEVIAPSVSWSSDSRFLVVPTAAGVAVFDLEDDGRLYRVLTQYWVLDAGVRPLRAPW